MEPGRLRHLITIEAPVSTQNAYGEPVVTWSDFASVYASREDLTGRELFAAQQVKAELTTRFTIRYLAGLSETMRIVLDGVYYDIQSVADTEGRKRTLTIMAARQVPNAA
jgi:SPP1 family predicted phage head-tail adaptor